MNSQMLYDKTVNTDAQTRIVTFNNILCVCFVDKNEIQRYKAKEKLESLKITEKVGAVHTLQISRVLLVSGDKGFAIFDQDF